MLHVSPRRFSGSGGLFGSGSSTTSTGDNLFSTDIVELLLGVSEGPIQGLKSGAQTFFIGDTPLKNVDGDTNFDQFELIVQKGSLAGEPIISRLGGFGSSTDVNTSLATNTPVVRSGTHRSIDYIDLRLVINQLQVSNSNGTFENTGKFKVEIKKTSDSTWTPVKTTTSNPLPDQTLSDNADAFYGGSAAIIVSGSPGDRPVVWNDTPPDTTDTTELWFDSTNSNRPQHLVSGSWADFSGLSFTDGYWVWSEASSWGSDKQTRAYVQPAPAPSTREQGDFWLDTSNNVVYFFNGAAWVVAGSTLAPGGFGANGTGGSVSVSDGEIAITGKTTTPMVKEFRIPVDNIDSDTYDVRITKTSPEDTTESFFDISWESFSELTARAFNFPGLATTQLVARASDQFSSIPEFTGVYQGRIVKVPSNYDPVARTYTGVWDGTWVLAYTNNGAYIVNDLVENDRYGLNAYYPVVLNKFDVYDAGVWCDTLTADNLPRFTFNMWLSDARGVREAINYIAGTFGGRFFDDGNGSASLKVDKPETAAKIFTKENVADGLFTYSFTDTATRYNDITVTFTNPDLNWNEDRRRVSDDDHITKYGRIPLDFVAVGCTSVSEAIVRGRYKLITGTTETAIVNFKTNRQGLYLSPYEIILVADEELNLTPSGRVVSVDSTTQFSPRDPIYLEAGVDYKVVFQLTESTEERLIPSGTSGTLSSIPVTADLPDLPDYAVFFIQTVDDSAIPMPFRVTSISPVDNDPDNVEIQAVQVNRQKWDYIDGTVDSVSLSQSDISLNTKTRPVPAVRIRPFTTVSGSRIVNNVILDWDASPTKTVSQYKITVSKDNGPAALLATTPSLSFEWDDIQPGEYLFSVIAVNAGGFESAAMLIEQRFVGDYREVNVVTNLGLVNEPDPAVFTTPSPMFSWLGVSSPDHSDYVIHILDDTDAVIGTYFTTNTQFTYEKVKNDTDGAGRSFKVSVASRDQFGAVSQFTTLAVSNPKPAPPSITFLPGIGSCTVKWPVDTVPDYAGAKLWISQTGGFDPATTTPLYDGPSSTFTFHGVSDTIYYVRLAVYDTFSSSDITISSQVSFTTLGVDLSGIGEEINGVVGYVSGDGSESLAARLDDLEQRIDEIALSGTNSSLAGYNQQRVLSRQISAQGASFRELITVAASDTSALSEQLTVLSAQVGENSAAITTANTAISDEASARATGDEEVLANVGNVLASGLLNFAASVAEDGTTATITAKVKAVSGTALSAAAWQLKASVTAEGDESYFAVLGKLHVLIPGGDGTYIPAIETLEDGTIKFSGTRMGRIDSLDGLSYIDFSPAGGGLDIYSESGS